ncbi:MAG: glycosyltransferase family 2 protein, partial [Tabrizicola sp.]|nr:glycosyltransferase family 2 protein [Tabrizicola sp.]
MVDWGIVSTVRASEDKVMAFVAHHLSLGAARIWLYFDDPDDPAFAAVAALPRVTATLCNSDYWQTNGGRHERHQNRQSRNAKRAQRVCMLPWIAHIDVDEFLWPTRPIGTLLAEQPDKVMIVRMEPFEAMHDPDLPDDIYTARQFRGALNDTDIALRPAVLGLYRAVMPAGML